MARTVIGPEAIEENTLEDADGDTKVQVEESSDEDKIRFDTAGSERMIITNAGLVGVGTTTPIAKLDVAGKIAITSEVSTPSAPADGKGWLYTKSDGKIYWQSNDVSETDLTNSGGSVAADDISTGDADVDIATSSGKITLDSSTGVWHFDEGGTTVLKINTEPDANDIKFTAPVDNGQIYFVKEVPTDTPVYIISLLTDGSATGYVGINQTSAANLLDIKCSANSDQGIQIKNSEADVSSLLSCEGLYYSRLQMKDTQTGNTRLQLSTRPGVHDYMMDNNLGIGTTTPGTLLQLEGSAPYITLKNDTSENSDGGCESRIIFEDHANVSLARIQGSHDGSSDDTKGDLIFSTHDGSSLTEALRIDSSQDATFAGDVYADKIRRSTDSGTTTKILLNDEAIKLYAGHSSDNICTVDSTGLTIDNGSLETATIDYTDGDLSMTIADGGKVTFAAGFDVGSDAAGDILYHNGTSYVRLAKGSADQVLTMNDAATAPGWEAASGGGGSDTFVLTDRGKQTSSPSTSYIYHRTALNGADWTAIDSVTSYPTFQYGLYSYHKDYVVWQVPVSCTLDSYQVKGLRKGGSSGYTNNTVTMSIYKLSSSSYGDTWSDHSDADPGVTKIVDIELTATNDMPFNLSGTVSSGNTISAGESLYYTIKATSAYSNSDHFWTISLKMTPT